ncbi:uncharacterized protein LOC101859590 [Aplysia californica]|uniref:Tachykinin-2 n=1 Tax=Aplysia californica TaxID=6500 RepID=A0A161R9R4_APLCA|nr:uncharacterized protein LOC101859590 [Aplysia californica]ADX20595.1 tachykinin-2 [Aplysia californica]
MKQAHLSLALVIGLVSLTLCNSAPMDSSAEAASYMKWPEIESEGEQYWDLPKEPSALKPQSTGSDLEGDVSLGSDFTQPKNRLPFVLDENLLLRLRNELAALRDHQLAASDQQGSGMEKKFKPSGFMGSRGKRFMPGLESLLLAKYYQDAKWKRQPHLGFHGSRG